MRSGRSPRYMKASFRRRHIARTIPTSDVTARDVYQARQRVTPLVVRTPLISSLPLTERVGAPATLKLESVQDTGSFKIRGTANKLLSLDPEHRTWGVVTYSTGNHWVEVRVVSEADEIVELGELTSGRRAGREDDEAITIQVWG